MGKSKIKDINQKLSLIYFIENNDLYVDNFPRGKRCDLHVHSKYSGKDHARPEWVTRLVQTPVTETVGVKECYTPPKLIYKLAKSQGMDFVTISDHDSITGAIELVEYSPEDTFINCEYTVDGGENLYIHISTPGLEYPTNSGSKLDTSQVQELHKELMRLREEGFEEFYKQCDIMQIRWVLNHPACSFNGKIPSPELFDYWCRKAKFLEVNNDYTLENIITGHVAKKYN